MEDGGNSTAFFTWALDRSEWSPTYLLLCFKLNTNGERAWMGPRACLAAVATRRAFAPDGNRNTTIWPMAEWLYWLSYTSLYSSRLVQTCATEFNTHLIPLLKLIPFIDSWIPRISFILVRFNNHYTSKCMELICVTRLADNTPFVHNCFTSHL
jgi:hypothetical protein